MSAETSWLFDLEGKTYTVDWEDISTTEAIVLKKFLGETPKGWLDLLSESDPEAIQFFVWLGLTREDGYDGKPADIDVPMFRLNIRDAVEPDGEADESDPTGSPEGETTP